MDREPPPVTVTAPQSSGPPPDQLEGAPTRSRRPPPTAVLGVLALAVLVAAAVHDGEAEVPPPPAPPPAGTPTGATATAGVTATASLAGAPTDQPSAQRFALTVQLAPFDGRSDSGGRLLGDEVRLLDVRVRGFVVELGDARSSVPLGRFGRSTSTRSTTVPVVATVGDCGVETQARRDVELTVQTGDGPQGSVRAVSDPEVVRALDRLVRRACRRPRG